MLQLWRISQGKRNILNLGGHQECSGSNTLSMSKAGVQKRMQLTLVIRPGQRQRLLPLWSRESEAPMSSTFCPKTFGLPFPTHTGPWALLSNLERWAVKDGTGCLRKLPTLGVGAAGVKGESGWGGALVRDAELGGEGGGAGLHVSLWRGELVLLVPVVGATEALHLGGKGMTEVRTHRGACQVPAQLCRPRQ